MLNKLWGEIVDWISYWIAGKMFPRFFFIFDIIKIVLDPIEYIHETTIMILIAYIIYFFALGNKKKTFIFVIFDFIRAQMCATILLGIVNTVKMRNSGFFEEIINIFKGFFIVCIPIIIGIFIHGHLMDRVKYSDPIKSFIKPNFIWTVLYVLFGFVWLWFFSFRYRGFW